MQPFYFKIGFLIASMSILSGCASTDFHTLESKPIPVSKSELKKEGTYHKVQKKETLWRIAKAYSVEIDQIISANNIPNAASIEVNQLILIPGASAVKTVPISAEPVILSATGSFDTNKDEFAWPIKGRVVSYFNDFKGDAINKGIDIEASSNDIVRAARGGKVLLSDHLPAWGPTIVIDHGDGFMSVYSQITYNQVKAGEKVSKGDPIARLAQVTERSLLYFQIRRGQIAVNPL